MVRARLISKPSPVFRTSSRVQSYGRATARRTTARAANGPFVAGTLTGEPRQNPYEGDGVQLTLTNNGNTLHEIGSYGIVVVDAASRVLSKPWSFFPDWYYAIGSPPAPGLSASVVLPPCNGELPLIMRIRLASQHHDAFLGRSCRSAWTLPMAIRQPPPTNAPAHSGGSAEASQCRPWCHTIRAIRSAPPRSLTDARAVRSLGDLGQCSRSMRGAFTKMARATAQRGVFWSVHLPRTDRQGATIRPSERIACSVPSTE